MNEMHVRRVTWDARKARSNLRKHGVSFFEAATVLFDPFARFMLDLEHADRELGLGMSSGGKVVVVVFSENEREIRIISAREANRHERKEYEEG